MPHAVFLRAANVGGHNVFSPKAFAADHPELGLTNIGHAGTFVSTLDDDHALRAELQEALPVDTPMAIVDQRDVQALVAEPPAAPEGAKTEVTVFLTPGDEPNGPWNDGAGEIRLAASLPWCAVTLRIPGGRLMPAQVLEKDTGRSCTTRSWGVMEKVACA